ncbi:MAG: DUF1641 domain-containing protein, partial [Bacteroidetes bacterium]
TLSLVEKLTAPAMVEKLEGLLKLADEAPGLMAMMGDMVDEEVRQADARGVNVDERLRNTLSLVEKLTAPAMVEKLEGLLKLADEAPGLMAMMGDMVDEEVRQADARGVNLDERLRNTLSLVEKLTAPAMVEKLEGLLKLADEAPGLMAMMGDMVDEEVRQADARGVNLDERLRNTLGLVEKLTAPAMVEKLEGLLKLADEAPGLIAMTVDMVDDTMRVASEKGFDAQAWAETIGTLNMAVAKAKSEPPANVGGIFGLFRALKDPDRQKGLGFMMNFLKQIGQNI